MAAPGQLPCRPSPPGPAEACVPQHRPRRPATGCAAGSASQDPQPEQRQSLHLRGREAASYWHDTHSRNIPFITSDHSVNLRITIRRTELHLIYNRDQRTLMQHHWNTAFSTGGLARAGRHSAGRSAMGMLLCPRPASDHNAAAAAAGTACPAMLQGARAEAGEKSFPAASRSSELLQGWPVHASRTDSQKNRANEAGLGEMHVQPDVAYACIYPAGLLITG